MVAQADIKKFLPEQFYSVLGKNIPALLGAINQGNAAAEKVIQACIDSLFLSTASGRYLVQLGSESGFQMPSNSGLDIRAYKVLVPIMVSAPKQTRITLNDLITAFYGSQRVKPNIVSSVAGPYSLVSGDNLIIQTERGEIEISIVDGQVSNLLSVSAQEIASVINTVQNNVIADTLKNRLTGLDSLRLTSSTIGTGAFLRISGGTLQNVLKFPKLTGTKSIVGTTYSIVKSTSYTDLITFTWNGVGTNPNLFLSNKNDVVTIRGLVDGAQPFSYLNGSYALDSVGYDYFAIRNSKFLPLSVTLVQVDANNFEFTSAINSTIFDNQEYAYTSETSDDTITITVPAIPPLAKRFLAGSSHLQGNEEEVLDFTRTSVKVQIKQSETIPVAENAFQLASSTISYNFRNKPYKTFLRDADVNQPTYSVDDTDTAYAALPFTTSTLIQADPIYGEVGSEEFKVVFPYRHGFMNFWGLTLSGGTGVSNVTTGMINQEHSVLFVESENALRVTFRDISGNPIKFNGVSWLTADLYRHPFPQADGSDFYLQFSNPAAAVASGLSDGTTFKFDTLAGTDVVGYLAGDVRYRKCTAKSTTSNIVNISTGLGTGPEGLIISSATGLRSSFFGGNVYHQLNKASTLNQEQVFVRLKSLFMFYTPSQNPAYVGSFVFDPAGVDTKVTVSKYVTKLTNSVIKGENQTALFVDAITSADGHPFPTTGEVVIDYATGDYEGPIRYFAFVQNPPNNQILIDPSYKFKKSHDIGSSVQYIHSKSQYKPRTDGKDYPVYITGSVAARNTLFKLVELLTAAGIFVEKDVILPELRYQDPSISPFL